MFTQDWFENHIPSWSHDVAPRLLANRPQSISFLEVGSYEGAAACWLLRHVLTEPGDKLVCVDPFVRYEEPGSGFVFDDAYEARFDDNIREVGSPAAVEKLKLPSAAILRVLPLETFHGCYIDGAHGAVDVLRDAVLAWDLLHVGGIMILDDYELWRGESNAPRCGIDAFLSVFRPRIEIVHQAWQVIAVKRQI